MFESTQMQSRSWDDAPWHRWDAIANTAAGVLVPKAGCVYMLQGIDLEAGGRNKKTWRTAPKSENVYLKLLVKVWAAISSSGT